MDCTLKRGSFFTPSHMDILQCNETKELLAKMGLILVSVNQGYTDAVMETAKASGAMGGTVLRARLVDAGLPAGERYPQLTGKFFYFAQNAGDKIHKFTVTAFPALQYY